MKTTHADRKYNCRKHSGGVVHDPRCRESRPRCRWRRKNVTCRCPALHFPHRAGSVRGCREGGIPEAVLKSRSYQQASARRGGGGWRSRIASALRKVRGARGARTTRRG